MAKEIHALKDKTGQIFWPATATDAVIHPKTRLPLTSHIEEYNLSSDNTITTLELGIAKLVALGINQTPGTKLLFLNTSGLLEEWIYYDPNKPFSSPTGWRKGGEVDATLDATSENPVQNKIITQVIEENEATTAAALIKLNRKIRDIVDLVPTTWAELVELRDSGNLVPGRFYRITDYLCTTSQTYTVAVPNQFDIIVLALSRNTLSETALADHHAGDTYFQNCNLEAWELKYSLDNDSNRFAWADTGGRGVIYYMKDEFENECPYDFKSIQFARFDSQYYSNIESIEFTKRNCGYKCIPHGRLTDSNYLSGTHILWDGNRDHDYYYTFTTKNQSDQYVDATVYYNSILLGESASVTCPQKNVILPSILKKYESYSGSGVWGNDIYRLNDIVLLGERSVGNTFGVGCKDSTLVNSNYGTFGAGCDRIFLKNAWSTVFGGSCVLCVCSGTGNIFHSGSSSIRIIPGDYNILYGNSSSNCLQNSHYCHIGITTSSVSLTNCQYITIADSCHDLTFINWSNSTVDSGSSYINGSSYFDSVIVGPGIQGIRLTCSATTSYSMKCRNIVIAPGFKFPTNNPRTITVPESNQSYQTIYKPANCQEISIV